MIAINCPVVYRMTVYYVNFRISITIGGEAGGGYIYTLIVFCCYLRERIAEIHFVSINLELVH